ncbi:MAG: NAD-dependent succinate-semialdehyde dehydrogenase [Acidobacteriaceae bacterium]|jgi:succinate-semialdehyde dehydrogenase/glutarate-semialdehyde dehydrogenase
MIQSLNPANGKLLRSFDPLTPDALNAKLAIATSAAKTYPKETLDQRIFWMRRLAALLEADVEELATTMTSEMGKTLVSARAEVSKCASVCRYYADNATRFLAPERIVTEHADSYVRYDPLGVILAVMPWNFPLWQVFRFLAPALMAGNIGLLKHASNVPQCALAIEALVRRAGFPRGVFQTLLIEARQVEHLLNDPRVVAVTLTGSEAAGRAVAAQAGWLIKKTVLELGGSDPFIVLPSANLDAAVANAIKARTINNGQSCIAAKRFIVHESIYPEFEKRFVAGMADLRIGNPMLETTDIGPLATPQILEELLQQVTLARESGGRVLTGGARALVDDSELGNYFQPTVIAGLMRNAAICQEELFGPVALLFRVASLDEAIALANDTPFGLAASAWTTDDAERQRLAVELQCGAVFFNTPVASDPRLPFGGIKRSGYGRELGAVGMREFLNAKTVVVAEPAVETRPTPPSRVKAEPEPEVQPQPELPAQPRPDKPSEFQHLSNLLREFDPDNTSSPSATSNDPALIQPEPIQAEPPPPEPVPSQLKPLEPQKDEDAPPPRSGSMLGLR